MDNKSGNIKHLIGSRIKQLRKARGVSQEALSEKIGMSSKYLSSIERGQENPTLDTFLRLAKALEVNVFELFNYSQTPSPKEAKKIVFDLATSGDKAKLEVIAKLIRSLFP